uniref:(northern house mosquito) hypothetical protein n=1 Tax=Culex pipiens TaxID=7175 RepID=A0A8D8MT96_CULPI
MRSRPRRVAARWTRRNRRLRSRPRRPPADLRLEASRQRRRRPRPRHRLPRQPNRSASDLARQVPRPERASASPTWPNPPRTPSRTKRPPPTTTRTNRPRWSSRRSRKRTASSPSGANCSSKPTATTRTVASERCTSRRWTARCKCWCGPTPAWARLCSTSS